jgi:hypothetical protein
VDYLRLTAKAVQKKGGPLDEKEARDIMAQFATFPPEGCFGIRGRCCQDWGNLHSGALC